MMVKDALYQCMADVRAAAGGALDDAAQPHLFDRLSWYEQVAARLDPETSPLIAMAAAHRCAAFLFLKTDADRNATPLTNWYGLAYRPVFSGNPNDALKAQLLERIAHQLQRHVNSLSIYPVPDDDQSLEIVRAGLQTAGWRVLTGVTSAHWSYSRNGESFTDYWARRPSALRNTVDRKRSARGLTTHIEREFSSESWRTYCEIYAASWKGPEGDTQFLEDLARYHGQSGSLRLGFACLGGKAIAAQLWTLDHGRALIHKLAYRQDSKAFSPGTILTADMIRDALDVDCVHSISFGTGDEPYKRDWMDLRLPLHTLRAWNPSSPRALAGYARAWTGQAVRHFKGR